MKEKGIRKRMERVKSVKRGKYQGGERKGYRYNDRNWERKLKEKG